MDKTLKNYLFTKHILVVDSGYPKGHAFEVLISMARLFGIRVTKGQELLTRQMIPFTAGLLGQSVPAPFYRGFPRSVRELTPDQLLFDQLIHYTETYGLGNWGEPGHSVFERDFERLAFAENVEPKDFIAVDEAEAAVFIRESAEALLSGTRPLSEEQFAFVTAAVRGGFINASKIRVASKDTAVRLLLEFRDLAFAKSLALPDVLRLAGEMNYLTQTRRLSPASVRLLCRVKTDKKYYVGDLRNLTLKNKDRKLLARLLDDLLECEITPASLSSCYEKKALWAGLLHHIHYRPKNERAVAFLRQMRGRGNASFSSRFEAELAAGDIPGAAAALESPANVLRHLQYLLSRCETEAEADAVLNSLDSKNAIVLLQLLYKYDLPEEKALRTFRFTRHHLLFVHRETRAEAAHRRSFLSANVRSKVAARVRELLTASLKGRLGRVYVDPAMAHIAVPVQETASQGGFGILPKGSRLPVPAGKKIRAFVYWEKVNDIDLSVIGISADGREIEFSWRTMAAEQSAAITFSGDETSGFHGGSEFFDIDFEAFTDKWPEIRYLVFCANVYSALPFADCVCRAGYMLRDTEDTGEIFEPKTVASSFTVNCRSTFAYLFALDLTAREFIWLNLVKNSQTTVAGTESLAFLTDYFDRVRVFSVYDLFTYLAEETVETPEEAEIAVTDRALPENAAAKQIHSYDIDRITGLL